MNVKDTLYYALQQRVYGCVNSDLLFQRARGSRYFVQCLERSATLTGHDGCVNTISWNSSGELLLSGSDDCRLNIYRPFQKKLLQSIRTGHRANIFSAKFLPCSADKKIVSCSGDGVLQLTDIEQPESFGKLSYNCHSGTVYEVITTPGDPNTFISCGEDGTVRLFDVRTKSNCNKSDCKDDILIESGKAITSISINPLAPYQLAIGCEDSTVALFDRRSLSTANASSGANGMKGMTYRFKPDTLRDRTCRVTSLQYSGDGSELLVSYCADYIYLFDTKGQKQVYSDSASGDHDNGVIPSTNGKKNVPMKRLRLRGDWSDTGPNARPESEGASTENTLMQRMSDLFVRWIEESFRGSVRRRRAAQSRESTSTSTSSSTSFPSRSTNSSSSDSSGILEASISSPSRDRDSEELSDELEESESNTPSVISVRERSAHNLNNTGESPMDEQDNFSKLNSQSNSSDCITDQSELVTSNANQSESSACNNNQSGPIKNEQLNSRSGEGVSKRHDRLEETDTNSSTVNENITERNQSHTSENVGNTEQLSNNQISNSEQPRVGGYQEGVASPRGEISQGDASQTASNSTNNQIANNEQASIENDEEGVSLPRGDSSQPNTQETGTDSHNEAATRIQRMFRNYKAAKSSRNISDCDYVIDGDVRWVPKMTRMYRGHRNARTMIKEARFWGDRHIVSGSDCGRIFLWDKNTTEIVMVLQGDRHVVNCVQPHPFDPVLASSGIDYDIKLWTPTASEPIQIQGLEEIISTNEQMLEESRDTITVPASFMLRMLASLNHARLGRNREDSDTESNDSD